MTPRDLIVINNDTDHGIVRHIPVLALGQNGVAPSFGTNTFAISPKGEIQLEPAPKNFKPRVLNKGLIKGREIVQAVASDRFTLGSRVVSEIRDRSANPCIAVYDEMHINGNTYYVAHRSAGEFVPKTFEDTHINIVFGTCLFDNESVQLVSGDRRYAFLDGKSKSLHQTSIDEISVDKAWTLYEMELITRLSHCIADTVSALNGQTTVTVWYNIPRVEYYTYLLEPFEAGNISPSCMERYFDVVDERHNLVVQQCIRQIRSIAKNIPVVSGANPSVEISSAESFSCLENLIRHNVAHGRVPSLKDAKTLLAETYPLWVQVLAHNSPERFFDLALLNWCYEYLAAGQAVSRPGDTLGLAIESYGEARILDNLKLVMEKMPHAPRSCCVHAMYPLKQVALYIGDDTVAADLYRKRPHPNVKNVNGDSVDVTTDFLKKMCK